MNYETTKNEDLNREYLVTVPAEEIGERIDGELKRIQKKYKKDGFREGNVPLDIVKKDKLHEVMGTVLDKTIQEGTLELFGKEKVKPAMQPKIEITDYKDGGDLKYKIALEVLPKVPEIDFTKVEVEKHKVALSESDINEGLQNLSSNVPNYVEVTEKRAAKIDDKLEIDFKGFVDGKPFKNGEGKNYGLVLGSGTFVDTFEQQLVGKNIGDKVNVNVFFPENYGSDLLKGKDAMFEVLIHKILEPKNPKIDAEFAKKMGYDSIDKLKDDVKKRIEMEYDLAARNILKKELFDDIANKHEFKLPEAMVNMELESIRKQLNQMRGEDFKETDEVTSEYKKLAERRVLLGILLAEVGEKHDIKVEDAEVQKAMQAEVAKYPGKEKEVYDFYNKNPQAVEMIRGPILEEKVVDYILTKAQIKEVEHSSKDLQALIEKKSKEADEKIGLVEN